MFDMRDRHKPQKGSLRTSVLMVLLSVAWMTASAVDAAQGCDTASMERYQAYRRLAVSLRPEKPGQIRVFAANGAEFTAGQALWIHGQLRRIDAACTRGDQAEANRLLSALERLIEAHKRGS